MHIGGIGVASTVVYYQRLIASVGPRMDLTIVHADASELVANNNADRRGAQARAYLPLLERLAAAGADCAAITSLGGHFCYAETEAISPLPLVSGVAPLDAYFAEQGFGCVGLLGTGRVMQSGLYGQLRQVTFIAPGDAQTVGTRYTDMALTGRANDADRAFFTAEAQQLMERGADAVVLAGTDLGLVFTDLDLGFPVIDALDVHVARLADLAQGKATL